MALSLRARQSSARVRESDALSRAAGVQEGEGEGALKGALTWLTTSRPIFSPSLSLSLSFLFVSRVLSVIVLPTVFTAVLLSAFVPFSAALCTRYDSLALLEILVLSATSNFILY